MKKLNVKVVSMIPGKQFLYYEEYKTVRELFRYAYSQLRLFSQKGAEYSFLVRDFETGKIVFWLHGFTSNIGDYVVVLGQNGEVSKTLNRIPLR